MDTSASTHFLLSCSFCYFSSLFLTLSLCFLDFGSEAAVEQGDAAVDHVFFGTAFDGVFSVVMHNPGALLGLGVLVVTDFYQTLNDPVK